MKELSLWIGSYVIDGETDWNTFVSKKDDYDEARNAFRATFLSDQGYSWTDCDYVSFEVYQITEVDGHKIIVDKTN